MVENFPNLINKIHLHIQEAPWTPSRITSKWPSSTHIIIKLLKTKNKDSLEKNKRSGSSHTKDSLRSIAVLQSETMEARGSGMTYSKCYNSWWLYKAIQVIKFQKATHVNTHTHIYNWWNMNKLHGLYKCQFPGLLLYSSYTRC